MREIKFRAWDKEQKRMYSLQKENEGYISGELMTRNQAKHFEEINKKYYIHKDKIREKIKEIYEDKFNKYYDMFLEQRDIEKTIGILKDLLKEE